VDEFVSSDPVAALVADLVAFIDSTPGEVHIALTGGRAGAVITPAVATAVADRRNAHLWFSDERYLPVGDPERNDAALPHDTGVAHVHRVTGASLHEAAANYSSELHHVLTTRFCSDNTLMDICVLSIGPDGHIASLFPHAAALSDPAGVVAVSDSPKPPPERVTFGFATINASRQVWLIATGEEKADAVNAIRAGAPVTQIPAAGAHGKSATRLYTDVA
jgi:6-phosphogluconolactonase